MKLSSQYRTLHTSYTTSGLHFNVSQVDAGRFELGVAGFALCLTFVLSAICLWRLSQVKAIKVPRQVWWRRPCAFIAAALPLVTSCVKFAILLWLEGGPLLRIGQGCYEALVVWCFLQFVLSFLGSTDVDVTETLASVGPLNMWEARPCCCCASILGGRSARPVDDHDIFMVRACVWQFVLVFPMALLLEEIDPQAPLHMTLFSAIRILAFVCLLYGIMALLRASHSLLDKRQCHMKFWTLKGMMVVVLATHSIALRYAMKYPEDYGKTFHEQSLWALRRSSVITIVLTVPFALLILQVFTADDLVCPVLEKERKT